MRIGGVACLPIAVGRMPSTPSPPAASTARVEAEPEPAETERKSPPNRAGGQPATTRSSMEDHDVGWSAAHLTESVCHSYDRPNTGAPNPG